MTFSRSAASRMKCESCKIEPIEKTIPSNKGLENGIWDTHDDVSEYRLCRECFIRLEHFALRPLEYFNMASTHGNSFYLHDDFYDYETGEAYQPKIKVEQADKFRFPKFDDIKNNLNQLIDFSFVQFYTEDYVLNQLSQFDKQELLEMLKKKVKYNRSINYKAYEIAGKIIKHESCSWIKEEWKSRRQNELHIFAEPICNAFDAEEAYRLITKEIESKDDRYLSENISALLYLQSSDVLEWIEGIQNKIKNVKSEWGQLAASSKFDWVRASAWLESGRPLSLIALDALIFCTDKGERLNQSLWMRKLDPVLIDIPGPEVVVTKLEEYLSKDNVPRTRKAIDVIIKNV